MKLCLIKLYSGPYCTFYTVKDAAGSYRYKEFINSLPRTYDEKLKSIVGRLSSMGNLTGALLEFFKDGEGLDSKDRVCALYDEPIKELRLYSVRFSEKIVILGSGGPKSTRTWQADPVLSTEVYHMMTVSGHIFKKIENGTLWLSSDGLKFEGDLELS